jgi:hypothetical protein
MAVVDVLDTAGTTTDEHQALRVDQHHPDAGSVGQILITRHSAKPLAYCRHALWALAPVAYQFFDLAGF